MTSLRCRTAVFNIQLKTSCAFVCSELAKFSFYDVFQQDKLCFKIPSNVNCEKFTFESLLYVTLFYIEQFKIVQLLHKLSLLKSTC